MNEAMMETPSPWSAEHRRMEEHFPGTEIPWVRELRAGSLAAFEAAGFPGPRVEAWRSVNLRPFLGLAFSIPVSRASRLSAGDLEARLLSSPSAPRMVFLDGRFAPELSVDPRSLPGVEVDSLAMVLQNDPESLRPHLHRIAQEGANPFALLNTAFLSDGAVVRIAKNAAPEQALHLVFVTLATDPSPAVHPRVLIRAEPGAEATVIEEYVSLGEANAFTNPVTELELGENARLRHLRLQHESEQVFHFATLGAHLERHAALESVSVALGGALSRIDLNVTLNGEGSSCSLNGLYAVAGRQTVDHHVFVDHAVPHTSSRQLYKGLLDGRSRAVFNGQILIRAGAQKSDAQQSNPNLLLSREALVNTNPQLRIFADDVKCKHGATIGQMDEDRVFYLRSRGLTEKTARRLIMRAFAAEILEGIGEDGLGSRLTQRVTERFV